MPDPEIQDPIVPAPATDAPPVVEEDKAAAERARIQGVLAQSIPGAESLVQDLAFDGKTTPEQAAVAVHAFHLRTLQGQAAALAEGASKPVPAAAAASSDEDTSAGLQAKWDRLHPAVKSAHGSFEAYSAAMARTAELTQQGRVSHFSKPKN